MRPAVLAERGKAGLTVTDFAEPVPATGEAVMKVHAASINHVDLYTVSYTHLTLPTKA